MGKLLIAAALAWTGLIATAHAEAGSQAPSTYVRYTDLDLSRPAGAEVMLHRIDAAAARVCGRQANRRELVRLEYYANCVREVTETAVVRLNAPLVTALHEGRQGEVHIARR